MSERIYGNEFASEGEIFDRLMVMVGQDGIDDEQNMERVRILEEEYLTDEMGTTDDETELYAEISNCYRKRTGEISEQNERLKKQLRQKEAILRRLAAENRQLKELECRYQKQLNSIGKTQEYVSNSNLKKSRKRRLRREL